MGSKTVHNGLKLNLGSGNKRVKNFVNVDMHPEEHIDIVHDLSKYPYPFKDDSVDEIRAWAICEHLHDLDGFLNECHRILKNEGFINIRVPYYNSSIAPRPDHVKYFHRGWFKIYLDDYERGSLHHVDKKKWDLVQTRLEFSKLGRVFKRFIGVKRTELLSFVLGEVALAVNTTLSPVKKDGGIAQKHNHTQKHAQSKHSP